MSGSLNELLTRLSGADATFLASMLVLADEVVFFEFLRSMTPRCSRSQVGPVCRELIGAWITAVTTRP
jgi:hypothetical protein